MTTRSRGDDEAYWTSTVQGSAAWTPEGQPLTLPDPSVPGSELQALYERWCRDNAPDLFPTEPLAERTTPDWFRKMAAGVNE